MNEVSKALRIEQIRSVVAALERRSILLFCSVSLLYFAVAGVLSSKRLLWNDELFTFYISRQPTMREVSQALSTGAEQVPPLFYVITRAFTAAFGDNRLSFRVPEILGFWVMCVSLFYFVRRHSSAAYGLIAMLFPMVTGAFYYAYEARPYGLVLGFSGLALLCWQRATEGRMRALSRLGLGLSLAAALSCHYYAVVCFAPFLLGECVRTAIRKRLDVWMWIALVSGLLPLAIFLPLIKAASGYSSKFWAKPHWTAVFTSYQSLLGPIALVLFTLPAILALYSSIAPLGRRAPAYKSHQVPLHEIAVAFGFVLVPICVMILAKTITGAFTDRYVVSAVIGLSILLAYSVSVIAQQSGTVGLLVTALLVTFFVTEGARLYRQFGAEVQDRAVIYRFLQSKAMEGVPLVIAGPHLFFELSHAAAERQQKANFIYLADISLATQYTDTDDVERGLLALRHWAPVDVRDFHAFCASHEKFLVYSDSERFAWLVKELLREGRRLTLMAGEEGSLLYLALSPNDQ